MKTCGQCKRYMSRQCMAPLPPWAWKMINSGLWVCQPDDNQAESCDCFAPKEDPKCTP
jgi:hypothetical protein